MAEPAYLLDSNVCIYVLRDARSVSAARLGDCEPGSVVTSAIVRAEVMRGLAEAAPAEIRKAHRLFGLVPVLPFDEAAALAYARIPFKRGRFDRLIAAHALALGLTVATANPKDFLDVPDLKVEDWTQ